MCLSILWVRQTSRWIDVICLTNEKLWENIEFSVRGTCDWSFCAGEVCLLSSSGIYTSKCVAPDKLTSWVHLSACSPLFGADKWFEFDTLYQLSPCWVLPALAQTPAEKKWALCNILPPVLLSGEECTSQVQVQMAVSSVSSWSTYISDKLPLVSW